MLSFVTGLIEPSWNIPQNLRSVTHAKFTNSTGMYIELFGAISLPRNKRDITW